MEMMFDLIRFPKVRYPMIPIMRYTTVDIEIETLITCRIVLIELSLISL
jgi:hypothetical protein